MHKKNILIISAVFPPEPVVSANISYNIAESLSFTNTVTVLSPPPSRPIGYNFEQSSDCKKGYNHIILETFIYPESNIIGRFRESLSFGKACSKYIKNNKEAIDVIYMNSWPLAAQFLTVKAADKFNIPIITHIQDIYPESLTNKLPILKKFLKNALLPIDKFITQKSSKVITISTGLQKLLVQTRKLSKNKVEVIYNWQDETRYLVSSEIKKEENNSFTFMFLGSLSPSASINTSIQAFINADLKDCKLIIAGKGSEQEKLRSLANNNPTALIEFCDASTNQVGILQAEANVLLLTLKKGVAKLALPSKLPAYMFSAKPIIASVDIGSDTANAIEKSGCGWVIEPESVEKLSISMKKAFETSRAQLEKIGENGFKYAMNQYSKEKNLQKLTNIITNLSK